MASNPIMLAQPNFFWCVISSEISYFQPQNHHQMAGLAGWSTLPLYWNFIFSRQENTIQS
jgi:hypothetical protein